MSAGAGEDAGVEHATSVGQTGGLPGANAHWRTSRLAEDELASTVQRGDVAAGSVDPAADVDEAVSSGPSGAGASGAGASGAGASGAGASGAGGSGAGGSGAGGSADDGESGDVAPDDSETAGARLDAEERVANGDGESPEDA